MNDRDELDLIQGTIARLRADLNAVSTALEAVMVGLPYPQQGQVIQHLREEAGQLEMSFSNPAVPLRATALRTLAGRLESAQIHQQDRQWRECASQETPLASSPHTPPDQSASTD